MGHEQRRRLGAPSSTLTATRPSSPYLNEFQTGMSAQEGATQAAAQYGHQLGSWEPYGQANIKARCMSCGAEVRVPFSLTNNGFMQHEGQAVNPRAGSCSQQAQRYPNRKRGTR
jgi:hypothetical protein